MIDNDPLKSTRIELAAVVDERKHSMSEGRMSTDDKMDIKASPFMLMPDSQLRRAWDITMMLATIYSITVLPFQFAFLSAVVTPDNIVCDVLFIMDVVIQMFCVHTTSTGDLLLRQSNSIKHYLKGWFTVDVISALPYSFIALTFDLRHSMDGIFLPVNILRLTRLLKAFKAVRLSSKFTSAEFNTRVHPGIARLARLVFSVFLVGHVSACLWYFIGRAYDNNPESWTSRIWGPDNLIKDKNSFEKYVVCLYYAFTTLTTVGYGDIAPRTRPEMVFAMMLFLLGVLMFSYTMANVTSLLYDYDRDNRIYRTRMVSLISFCRSMHIKPSTQTLIINQMAREWRRAPLSQDWDAIRTDLPADLRHLIMWECHSKTLSMSKMFTLLLANGHQEVHQNLVASIQPFHAVRGQIIGKAGDTCKGLYVIAKGAVEQFTRHNDHPIAVYSQGHSFGEVGLLLSKTCCWPSTYKCKSASVLLYISAAELDRAINENEQCRELFMQRANSKLIKLQALGSGHDIMSSQFSKQSVSSQSPAPDTSELEAALSQVMADIAKIQTMISVSRSPSINHPFSKTMPNIGH